MAEYIAVDGLSLTDGGTYDILEASFAFTPAPKKLNWVGSPLADGLALQGGDESHYDNAEMAFTIRVRPQADEDAARVALGTVTNKLQEARRAKGGLPMVWIPEGSTQSFTYYVQEATFDELPMGRGDGITPTSPQMAVHLFLRPFGYGPEGLQQLGWSDSFLWDGITGGRWRVEAGSGTVSVGTGIATGNLIVSSTAEKRLYLPWSTQESTTFIHAFVGSTVGTGALSAIMRRLDGSNHVRGGIRGGTGLVIAKFDAGTGTDLATVSYTLTANTWYWVVVNTNEDDITITLFDDTADPRYDEVTPLETLTHTLVGANATKFGGGIRGNPGIRLVPGSTSWLIGDFTLRGMNDVKSSEPLLIFELPEVQGQVPAEGRQVVIEGSAKSQGHYEWGLEQRSFDSAAAPPLILDSQALVTAGFAGSQSPSFNAYDPDGSGNNVILSTGLSNNAAVAVCSTGSLNHVGNFKVKARVTGNEGVRFRLAWRIGDGPFARNNYSLGVTSDTHYQEVDLGGVVIPEAQVGTQSWTGRIEAYSPQTNNGALILDYIELIPGQAYGVARAPSQPFVATTFSARDRFNQAVTGTSDPLHGKVDDVSNTWSTSGPSATDFEVIGADDVAQRVANTDANILSGRYAENGATDYGPIQVQVDALGSTAEKSSTASIEDELRCAVFARYVDANNWLMAALQSHSTLVGGGGGASYFHTWKVRAFIRVAGSSTQIGTVLTERPISEWMTLVLAVDAVGTWQVYAYPKGTKQPSQPRLKGSEATLATTLATGTVGMYDANASGLSLTRQYDNFTAFGITPDVVINASKALEVRADRVEREAATGSTYGKVPQYQGSRFYIPPAGDAERVSRMAVKARRTNVDEGLPDDNAFTDSLTVSVYARPRYLIPATD